MVEESVAKPCSDGARERHDPLIATAPPVHRWLLLEQPRGWPSAILTSPELTPYRQRIAAIVSTRRARMVLVRRHGRAEGGRGDGEQAGGRGGIPEPLTWVVVDPLTATEESGVWSLGAPPDPGLSAALAAFEAAGPLPEAASERLLVCTHGRHDPCCATRGRPVAAALAARFPHETWETSHVGGDRFAANLVVLPSGTYYGGLDPASALHVVLAHRAGRVAATNLRGVTTRSPVAQAALTGVLDALGPASLPELVCRVLPPEATTPGPGAAPAVAQSEANHGTWRVEVTGHPANARVLVEVRRGILPRERRSCHAEVAEVAVTYFVRIIVVGEENA